MWPILNDRFVRRLLMSYMYNYFVDTTESEFLTKGKRTMAFGRRYVYFNDTELGMTIQDAIFWQSGT